MPKPSIDSNRAVKSGCKAEISSATRAARRFRPARVGVALLWSALASAQEMEPRAYSAVPVGTNFVGIGYARSSGGFSVDPSLPITNVQARINAYAFGY